MEKFLNKIILGNALEVLKEIPDNSIDCVITSPPYWSLRDYGKETITIWGGNKDCEHDFNITTYTNPKKSGSVKNAKVGNDKKWLNNFQITEGFCSKCNAWKGSLGQEPSIGLFIENLCLIFNEIKRILKPAGTIWVNLADSYGANYRGGKEQTEWHKRKRSKGEIPYFGKTKPDRDNIPDKSLCLIPERFAIQMVNRGWILRNVIVWSKGNPSPESVTDRFTKCYEYVYFFVKNKSYFFEQQFEPQKTKERRPSGMVRNRIFNYDSKHNKLYGNKQVSAQVRNNHDIHLSYNPRGRNKRTVWSINTKPLKSAHFAAFPPELVKTPILAGCPEFICSQCGEARKKIFDSSERINTRPGANVGSGKSGTDKDPNKELHSSDLAKYRQEIVYKEIGYTTCSCPEPKEYKRGIVLDPFAGAGTTCLVAKQLNRNFIGIELQPEYIKIAEKRIGEILI